MNHPGFLKAICEEPDDDAHRLIYADWLDDHGESDRAEFIRLQCALEEVDDDDEAMTLREAELLRQHGETWRAELPGLPKVVWGNAFRRGFIDGVSLPNYNVWRSQGLAMLAASPLEMVCIHQVTPNTVRRLARSPGIDRVRGLEFPTGNFGDEELEVLGKTCRLRTFHFRYQWVQGGSTRLGPGCSRILSTSVGFRALRHLLLESVSVGDEGAARLASAPNLTELETLQLTVCGLTAAGVKLLTTPASWPRLRSLDLSHNNIADGGARLLASCPGLSELRELRLVRCLIGEAGATALSRSMFLTNLTTLELGGCQIGSDGLRALISSSNLRGLRVLDLTLTNITGADIVSLLRSPLGTNLRELDVQLIPIDEEPAAAIVATPGLENLTRLTVSVGYGTDLLQRHFGDRITIL